MPSRSKSLETIADPTPPYNPAAAGVENPVASAAMAASDPTAPRKLDARFNVHTASDMVSFSNPVMVSYGVSRPVH
jgi:hypothetical protein